MFFFCLFWISAQWMCYFMHRVNWNCQTNAYLVWHLGSITLVSPSSVPVCLCASPCSLFSLFGQNIPPHRYPLLLISQDAKLWTNITSWNLQHKPHLVSLIKSNMVNCQIIKAFQSLIPQQISPPHHYPLLLICQDVRMQSVIKIGHWQHGESLDSQNSPPLFSLFCGQSTNTCKSAKIIAV